MTGTNSAGRRAGFLLVACTLAGTGTGTGSASAAQPELPIFELQAPDTAAQRERFAPLAGLAKTRLHAQDARFQGDDRRIDSQDDLVLQIDERSGGVWFENRNALWNPRANPRLLDWTESRRRAAEFLQGTQLLPRLSPPFRFQIDSGATWKAEFDRRTEVRTVTRLDRQVIYRVALRVHGVHDDIPMVGGGGEFNVVLGDSGRLIGFSGVWRTPRQIGRRRMVPPTVAEARIRALAGSMERAAAREGRRPAAAPPRAAWSSPSLAYYSAPSPDSQRYLYPVWVFSVVVVVDGIRIAQRAVVVPATSFVPPEEAFEMQPMLSVRDSLEEPRSGSLAAEVHGTEEAPYELGMAWLGLGAELKTSFANTRGLWRALELRGWRLNFDRGDDGTWERDWTGENHRWVDQADLVYYTGHASGEAFVVQQPDEEFVSDTRVGPQGDPMGELWGNQDLEWLVVAACGPLQDELLSRNGGDVFGRWAGAFNGMHILMGFGSASQEHPLEGATFARYALDGEPLVRAWLRAAREVQPSVLPAFEPPMGPTVWAGVLYAVSEKADPYEDRLWGEGPVSDDPVDPDVLIAIWTTT